MTATVSGKSLKAAKSRVSMTVASKEAYESEGLALICSSRARSQAGRISLADGRRMWSRCHSEWACVNNGKKGYDHSSYVCRRPGRI
jgi:hypothetical protein